ncbi:L-threonylcarbamoyladenylate synthase [Herbaspirillum sp. SJZ107]|uniref:L-threonylcarbamoyladenylate synthase n=1 Tax=Herbaspirillum sp. SJZ107 TaxID=2572881 RepID=UPI0011503E38|nr:L-threonylcarbamoyladenylate synthase [Herbaspirillum sp. SJZ107]TQK07707.1 tRNA threonylcarbamoyl adenosine modification protein (Sua5/YciO/YrdC/YwlC family) [Herbaspirillum sp. SJZ107]
MTHYFEIHPVDPQQRLIRQAAQLIQSGGIAAVPTDSAYSLVCRLDDKAAVEKLRRIRGVDDKHHLTLLVRDLSEIATYARVDNRQYRQLKSAMPGPYTVILEATKEVPRRLSHPSRKTIGVRVPENPILLALLEEVGEPLIGTTLQLPGDDHMLSDPEEVRERLDKQIEVVIDGGAGTLEPTTIIDLSGADPVLLREGRGDPAVFGL